MVLPNSNNKEGQRFGWQKIVNIEGRWSTYSAVTVLIYIDQLSTAGIY